MGHLESCLDTTQRGPGTIRTQRTWTQPHFDQSPVNILASNLNPKSSSIKAKFTQPPFKAKANQPLSKELLPKDHQGRYQTQYCKKGVHLFGEYYALWDGYYALYDQKVYPLVFIDNCWYIFQKTQNSITKEWEGGVATHIAPAALQLNPNLDPFEGDLLRIKVIWPIEEELDLLIEQVHEALEEEPEPEVQQPDSAQESNTSIQEAPKRMSAITITPTQSTIAMALTSRSGPPRQAWSLDWPAEVEEEQAEQLWHKQPPLKTAN